MAVKVLALLALFLTLSSAYVDQFKYYFYADLRPQYAYVLADGEQNNNRGLAIFEYDGSSRTLKYHIAFTNSFFETLTLNGPVRCTSNDGGFQGENDANCVNNIGPVIYELAKGISIPPEGTEPKQNVFINSISISDKIEQMLFDGEIYVLVTKTSQPLPGEKVGKTSSILRGRLFVPSTEAFRALFVFSSNDGSYGPKFPKTQKSVSTAFGYVEWTTGSTLRYDVFHNIDGPGRFILNCPSKSETVTNTATSPVTGSLDLSADDKKPLLMSVFSDEGCFFFFTSSALAEGDIFARPTYLSPFQVNLDGKSVVPAVTTGNFGKSFVLFDRGTKILTIITKTNVTTGEITSAQILAGKKGVAATADPICTPYTKPENSNQDINMRTTCKLNSTLMEQLENEELYFQISTNTNPNGEIRGQIWTSYKFKADLKISGGGLSEGAKIGLGVGLGVGGALLVIGIIVVAVVFSRKE